MQLLETVTSGINNIRPGLEKWWIWYQNWLASSPDALKIRTRVENALKKGDVQLNDGDKYNYTIPMSQDIPVNIIVGGNINELGLNGVYQKIIRTVSNNTTIKFWKIHFPGVFGIDRQLTDLLVYKGYKDITITHENGGYFVSFTHSNPSRFPNQKNSSDGDNPESDSLIRVA